MRHVLALLVSIVFLLSSAKVCLGENVVAPVTRRPTMGTNLLGGGLAGTLNLPRPVREKQVKWWRRAVMPKVQELSDQDGAKEYFGALDPHQLKRTLVKVEPGRGKEVSQPRPQGQGERVELTLQESIEIALKNNLGIRITELTKDALEQEVSRAKAKFHPTVGLAVTGSGDRSVPEAAPVSEANAQSVTAFISQEVPTGAALILSSDLTRGETHPSSSPTEFGSGLTLSIVQPLFRGGRIFVATKPIKDAEFDLRAAQARLRAEVLQVTAATKSAYYNMTFAEKVIEVTEAAIQRDKALIEASQALFKAGLVTKRDVFSAELLLAQDSARLVSAQADLESAKNALLDILGLPISLEARLLDKIISFQPVPLELERWIATAIRDRPEILEIQEVLAKSSLNIRNARNTVLPQVDLVASYGRSQIGSNLGRALDLSGRAWSVGLVFSVPFGNVAAKSELTKAEIEHARLREALRQTERQIELEVRAAVIKLRESVETMKALTVAVAQAKGKLEVAKARFALGQATNLDITDAQGELLDAETELLRATINYNIGLAELEARIAGSI